MRANSKEVTGRLLSAQTQKHRLPGETDTSPLTAVAEACCSSANLGPGFDVFGLALARFRDKVSVSIIDKPSVRISIVGSQAQGIPTAISRNSAGPPVLEMIRRAGFRKGLEIRIEKNVPVGIGIGSSGATAAACVKALDSALELKLSNQTLVQIASLGEEAVAGSRHADNVAASLLGGFVIVYGKWPPRAVSCLPPPSLEVVIVTPAVNLPKNKTRLARSLVPKTASMKDVVLNIGRASAMAAGFSQRDPALVSEAMEDALVEPYREKLIPGYSNVKRGALSSGAYGVAISGAGPSVIALVDNTRGDSMRVAKSMVGAFTRHDTRSTFFISKPGPPARILRRK